MKKLPLSLIVSATNKNFGIGINNEIPWKLPKEMKYFQKITTKTENKNLKNAVIMGRKTWESIPSKFKPLSNRFNIILSRKDSIKKQISEKFDEKQTQVFSSFEESTKFLIENKDIFNINKVFVIGGGGVYKTALEKDKNFECKEIFLTKIYKDFKCNTYFPKFDENIYKLDPTYQPFQNIQHENDIYFQYCLFQKSENNSNYIPIIEKKLENENENENEKIHEEYQYLNLIEKIIQKGIEKGDRTGVGTKSLFGCSMRFNLRKSFPLLTTKRVFHRGVIEELLWFIKGETNNKKLQEKKIHIWDGNSSRKYLDKIGLKNRKEGDCGPIYGFQWRHWNAKYIDMFTDYKNQGVDQLMEVINTIKKNPNSRRILMSAWNVSAIPDMCLPPCHILCQFYVANGELSCQMYQRSCDMGLGVPFNIASYSLLTCMIAQVCGLKPGDFVHVLGDTHVYLNHIEPLKEQLKRKPKQFPLLKLNPNIKNIEDFKLEDIKFEGYKPHKTIKMEMAV